MSETIASLRSTTSPRSTRGVPTCTPNSAARRTWCATVAEAIIVFVGMQPRLRHVPPRVSFSTNAVRPLRAARSAIGRPAIPPPITRLS
jgi:hypothetical protein